MAEVKDKRITPRKKAVYQSAQAHGSDLLNGTSVGHSLPFVAEKEPGYYDLMTSSPLQNEETLNPQYSGGNGAPAPVDTTPPPVGTTPIAGRPGYVAPAPAPAPAPTPAPTPPTFQGGGLTSPVDSGGGTTTLPVSSPPVMSSPAPASLTPTDTTPSAPPAVISNPATASPQPPVANAGPNQTITGSIGNLDGSGSSDPQESQLTFNWVSVSGPNIPLISDPSGATTPVTNLNPGTYTFRLTVTNALGMNNTSTTSITVSAPDNSGATVNTGVTTLNSGSTVLTTAPLGGSGLGPYGSLGGGGGGGGGSATDDTGTAPESTWQKIVAFSKQHWLLLALLALGTGYVLSKKDGKGSV